MIELITGLVTDVDSHVLLARSEAHGWWELPGTRSDDPWHPDETLCKALLEKVGLTVDPTTVSSRVAHIEKTVAGVSFVADVHRIRSYDGVAVATTDSGYSEIRWIYPLQRKLGRISLSPIAASIMGRFQDDPNWLHNN